MIKIHPSPTADTRTCDWSKVTKETLLSSSQQHIRDIRAGLAFFSGLLSEAGARHDHDKITAIDHFHADFRTGFKQTGWWDNHRKVNRHHLTEADGIPADVNLIDVLDFIVDCTMAGLARSGSVRPLVLDPAVLQRAFDNTASLLKANVEVVPPAPSRPAETTPDAKGMGERPRSSRGGDATAPDGLRLLPVSPMEGREVTSGAGENPAPAPDLQITQELIDAAKDIATLSEKTGTKFIGRGEPHATPGAEQIYASDLHPDPQDLEGLAAVLRAGTRGEDLDHLIPDPREPDAEDGARGEGDGHA
jgi:hypothetical protein